MKQTELSLCVVKQGNPTGAYTDSRMPIDDLMAEDAAAIRAGKALMLEVRLLRKEPSTSVPVVVDTLFNRVASPESVGTYSHPSQIVDPQLRREATDMWASQFRGLLSQDVRHRGRTYRVQHLEGMDRDGGEEGYLTGFAVCRRTDPAPSGRPCNPKRLPLHELKPVTRRNA
ncbi:hypothetical protein [Streptomyces acidiscabies]|uniref:Uncharacterized protein n=1 Tax=Streptomyces acidiscabies TaxID=42234 RepID=A0ABU4LWW8_9ACTN|nr:hypothetical protein [Streptomyces acidiscabies]MDX3020001.1 hypothetical protein [Streptomyces acidiscabies]